ncbi:hypothetical protein U1Q18_019224 [Sarracenia purpurea var. burkii]
MSNDIEIGHWICLILVRFGGTNGGVAEELPLSEVAGACEGGAEKRNSCERRRLRILGKIIQFLARGFSTRPTPAESLSQ